MSLELKGRCIQVMPVETGMGKKGQWNKLVFVIETASQYPKKIAMTLWDVNKAPAVGDDLTCYVDPESREYAGKWYTDLRCWKIDGFTGNMKRPLQTTNPKVDDDGVDWGKSSVGGSSSSSDEDTLPF